LEAIRVKQIQLQTLRSYSRMSANCPSIIHLDMGFNATNLLLQKRPMLRFIGILASQSDLAEKI